MSRSADGVYFDPLDYAGFGRRLASGVIDALVMMVAWFSAASAVLTLRQSDSGEAQHISTLVLLLVAFVYLAVLKRSRLRTLGYRLAGLRVVDFRGERPSFMQMFLRSGFALLGPGNLLLDLVVMLFTRERQKLSDMSVGTYVVRFGAQPVGEGRMINSVRCIGTYFFVCREIRRAL